MKKKVVMIIVAVVILAITAYGSYLAGVESQKGTITELESVKRDKRVLVATIKERRLQNYFNNAPLTLRMELDKPMTLLEQYSLY